jgi:hypothetical protein
MAAGQWVTCLVVGSIVAWVMEVAKLIRRRRLPDEQPSTAAPVVVA